MSVREPEGDDCRTCLGSGRIMQRRPERSALGMASERVWVVPCGTCNGTGHVRQIIDATAIRDASTELHITSPREVRFRG